MEHTIITVATIRVDDKENGRIINIDINPTTGEIMADGDDAMLGTAASAEDAFERICGAWGEWATFEVIAEYGEGWEINAI